MLSPFIYDTIGAVGVIIILVTYFCLQIDKISSKTVFYSVLNFVGSFCITFSLIFEWNLSAFLIEAAWVIISFYGILKNLSSRRQINSNENIQLQNI